jgi:hypothetical protein
MSKVLSKGESKNAFIIKTKGTLIESSSHNPTNCLYLTLEYTKARKMEIEK